MAPTPPAIRVAGLHKSYGSFTAIAELDFEIAHGETFALLGPNGAGKSTTIEILEGYRDRSGGVAEVLGVDPQHGGLEWKARLGIVLQQSGESANLSVRELLRHVAGLYPSPRDVEEVISAVGLEAKAGSRVKALSGGQRRRVDVALGIIGRPELLFLDEPTTGFDPEARRQFWDLIRSLSAEGTTILLTTHYLDEAAQLSDRAGVIAAGRLIDIGPIDQLGPADARVPIVRWHDGATVREERTSEPSHLVSRLTAEHGELAGLEVIRPSLEDIYLDLVATAEPAATATATATAPAPAPTETAA
ncbi:ABC transporter ATP-binding protein [Herbiconiux moechotypicola]|uniref:ABC transporter ATP-binding protein n=1 Tax=Herbiconiux moechotypicola TaxID=637393 RepID=A0ABN3DQ03_9MICO|nr:ABC transporter ATP-binding protein [Herbiconiux moechotypicola]MCS5731723.1 ABC transporter ATP-binding protein [Herbiconiux moechotypicola]